jgi:predicted nucleic acid-binding Zn ribbon protein
VTQAFQPSLFENDEEIELVGSEVGRNKDAAQINRSSHTVEQSIESRGMLADQTPACEVNERISATCPNCSEGFVLKKPHKRFCSDSCRKIAFRKAMASTDGRREAQLCHCCGERYIPKRSGQRYCGRKCQSEFNNTRARARALKSRAWGIGQIARKLAIPSKTIQEWISSMREENTDGEGS